MLVFVLALTAGCNPTADAEVAPVRDETRSDDGPSPEAGEGQPVDDRRSQPSGEEPKAGWDEKKGVYRYLLPKNVDTRELIGIRVEFEATRVDELDGFVIDVVAESPTEKTPEGKPRRLKVGSVAIFKPLIKGERSEMLLQDVPRGVWRQLTEVQQIELSPVVSPGNPAGVAPDVELKIRDVEAIR